MIFDGGYVEEFEKDEIRDILYRTLEDYGDKSAELLQAKFMLYVLDFLYRQEPNSKALKLIKEIKEFYGCVF